jgi:hypothetical protein
MERTRTIACAPARGTTQAWGVISDLVTDTLTRSADVQCDDVEAALSAASGVGRQLIAGGHLENDSITLVAEKLYLKITTVSGDEALTIEENLAPVPGGASACDWMLHLPPCEPLAAQVRAAAEAHSRLSAKPPAAPSGKATTTVVAVDDDTLRRWAQEGS